MNEEWQDIKLYNSNEEREKYDNMAELFSIVQTIELVEKAFIKDSITASEYTPSCEKLIAQFKTCQILLKNDFSCLEDFMKEYSLSCPAALSRLKIGIPATLEYKSMDENEKKKTSQCVAETVQYFITLMDSIRLKLVSIDDIHPQLNDLLQSIHKIKTLPENFETKIKKWLEHTGSLKASDELNEEDTRQLLFDLEQSYSSFYKFLE